MKLTLLSILLYSFISHSQTNSEIELDSGWTFSTHDQTQWFPASVPGVIHLDLLNNGLIGDPYWENNEIEQKWIENKKWQYKRIIIVDDTLLMNEHIELVCKGLDTYADVQINGCSILETNNMFREWVVDIKSILKKGENELKILFKSPITVNREKFEKSKYELPSGNETSAIKVGAYTRKAAYHFGWDWCPRMVTAGIWRKIFIRTWNDLRMDNIHVVTKEISNKKALLEFNFEIYADDDNKTDYQLSYNNRTIQLFLKQGLNIINESIQVNDPKLWFPNGYGHPKTYLSSYKLMNSEREIESGYFHYAIRQIELIQEKDSMGTSFYFNVNGIPVYIKGANYVPQDMFLPRVDPLQYSNLIEQVKNANMNMLRVWGGGIYEDDYFYQLCDYNGILVWQDFMFANSMYPNDSVFHDNIEQEIRYNVKRLRNHPCIALWCGNNEIEVAWENWGWQKQFGYSAEDSSVIWTNYKNIFHKMIPEIVNELNPTTSYVSSTPLSNWGTAENFNHSSMHYWGVWHGDESLESYANNVGRFMVEYGFHGVATKNWTIS